MLARSARLKPWKIIPMLPRTWRSRRPPSSLTVYGPTCTVPEVTGTSELMVRIKVDLPEPDSPTTETISPGSIANDTPRRPITPLG